MYKINSKISSALTHLIGRDRHGMSHMHGLIDSRAREASKNGSREPANRSEDSEEKEANRNTERKSAENETASLRAEGLRIKWSARSSHSHSHSHSHRERLIGSMKPRQETSNVNGRNHRKIS